MAMHAKTKQSTMWRKLCHGRVWEEEEEEEEERQGRAGKGCDGVSPRPLEQCRQAGSRRGELGGWDTGELEIV